MRVLEIALIAAAVGTFLAAAFVQRGSETQGTVIFGAFCVFFLAMAVHICRR